MACPSDAPRSSSYALAGLFSALGGLAITANTGIGTPLPGGYTLTSVAAVVLGGVSLAGGRGGVFGPIVAVIILALIRTDMTFLSLNSNLATVTQGVILIARGHVRQPRHDAAGAGVTGAQATVGERPWLTGIGLAADCSASGRSCRCLACWSS